MENMYFHSLPRRELQALCKEHKIPANMTNVAMADALKLLYDAQVPGETPVVQEPQTSSTVNVPPGKVSNRASARRNASVSSEDESAGIRTRSVRSSNRFGGKEEVQKKEIDGAPLIELEATPQTATSRKTRVQGAMMTAGMVHNDSAKQVPVDAEIVASRLASMRSRPKKMVSFVMDNDGVGEKGHENEVKKTPFATRSRSKGVEEKSAGTRTRSLRKIDMAPASIPTTNVRRSGRLKGVTKMVKLSATEDCDEGDMETVVMEKQNCLLEEVEQSDSTVTHEMVARDDGEVESNTQQGSTTEKDDQSMIDAEISADQEVEESEEAQNMECVTAEPVILEVESNNSSVQLELNSLVGHRGDKVEVVELVAVKEDRSNAIICERSFETEDEELTNFPKNGENITHVQAVEPSHEVTEDSIYVPMDIGSDNEDAGDIVAVIDAEISAASSYVAVPKEEEVSVELIGDASDDFAHHIASLESEQLDLVKETAADVSEEQKIVFELIRDVSDGSTHHIAILEKEQADVAEEAADVPDVEEMAIENIGDASDDSAPASLESEQLDPVEEETAADISKVEEIAVEIIGDDPSHVDTVNEEPKESSASIFLEISNETPMVIGELDCLLSDVCSTFEESKDLDTNQSTIEEFQAAVTAPTKSAKHSVLEDIKSISRHSTDHMVSSLVKQSGTKEEIPVPITVKAPEDCAIEGKALSSKSSIVDRFIPDDKENIGGIVGGVEQRTTARKKHCKLTMAEMESMSLRKLRKQLEALTIGQRTNYHSNRCLEDEPMNGKRDDRKRPALASVDENCLNK